jgi:FtsP/CotA-like multicopper oxidase with cupredoxin domain
MQPWSRRRFLGVAAAATLGMASGGCGIANRSRPVGPAAKEVAAAEARRRRPGAPVRELTLTATAATIDLAGRAVTAWTYNHTVPGPLLRVRVWGGAARPAGQPPARADQHPLARHRDP